MEEAKIFGMKMSSAVTILCILVVLLIILIIFIIHKMNVMARKYEMLMSGKKGADLEKIIRIRFKEMDQVKANARRVTKEHRQIKKHLSSCISKYALVKYDAFDKMAGKLSFVIALLNDENSTELDALEGRLFYLCEGNRKRRILHPAFIGRKGSIGTG